jgi:hypothetical protein
MAVQFNMTNNEIVVKAMGLAEAHNICNIKVKNGKATCNDGTPCCVGCSHLSESGCTVEAHGCRFWFCDTAFGLLPFEAQWELYTLLLMYEGQLYFRHDGYPIDTTFFGYEWLLKAQ